MIEKIKEDSERGVSPVIGVILMLGLVVAAAALVSIFVFNSTGQQTGNSAQASLDFSENSSAVTYTVISNSNVDNFTADVTRTDGSVEEVSIGTAVGSETVINNISEGSTVVVRANVDGEEEVIRQDTYEP